MAGGKTPGVLTQPGAVTHRPGPLNPAVVGVGPAIMKLKEIRVVHGAFQLRPGVGAPADTQFCATIRERNAEVLLEAIFIPTGSGNPVVPADLRWHGGGIPYTKNRVQRAVNRNDWGKFTVSVSSGGITKKMVVYVIGAEPTGFRGDGANHFPDNAEGFPSPLGIQPINPTNGRHADTCEIQYTVRPAEFVTDSNMSLFDKNDVMWDVSRDKLARYWSATAGPTGPVWTLDDDRGSAWASDDSWDDEEDNNPLDSKGHIYGNDRPSHAPSPGMIAYVKKLRMREWVRVSFAGMAGRAGLKCSDYQYWHIFRSLVLNGGRWETSNQFGGNEMKAGDIGWGPSPT